MSFLLMKQEETLVAGSPRGSELGSPVDSRYARHGNLLNLVSQNSFSLCSRFET